MKSLIYPRRHETRREARRVRNLSRFIRQKHVRTKVRFCVYCPAFGRGEVT